VKAWRSFERFRAVEQRGTEHRDESDADGIQEQSRRGVLGGISSGQDIVVSIALKPTSSITCRVRPLDVHGNATQIATTWTS